MSNQEQNPASNANQSPPDIMKASESEGPPPDFLKNSVFLVDASSYIFRAYYAIRQGLTSPSGIPTHATYGFCQMLMALYEIYQPENVVFVWDTPAKGFRHQIFPQYKANRTAPPEDLGVQIQNSKRVIEVFGIFQIEKDGFEADDIIATIIAKHPDKKFVIVTGDKDLMQLVGPQVWCLDTMKNKWTNQHGAFEKFGVTPEQIRWVQALSGDSVDNIPGAPGIGPKTATDLVQVYGDLDTILSRAKELYLNPELQKNLKKTDPMKGKRIESIYTNHDLIRLSLDLVSLHPDVPIETVQFFQSKNSSQNKDEKIKAIQNLFAELGFKKMLDKSLSIFVGSQSSGTSSVSQITTEVNSQTVHHKKWDFICVQSLEELSSILLSAENQPRMSLDTETRSLDVYKEELLVGISLSFNENTAYYIPLRHELGQNGETQNSLRNLDFKSVRILFQDYFKKNIKQKIIFQNAKFDLHVFKTEGFLFSSKQEIEDTMVASYCYDPSESHGMDYLSEKYLEGYRPQSFKEVLNGAKHFGEVSIDNATHYSAEDALVTLKLWNFFEGNLQEMAKVYNLIDKPLIQVLYRMERRGFEINTQSLGELSKEFHTELRQIELKARQTLLDSQISLADDFNLLSTKQMAEVLYQQLKLPIKKKGKTGPSTDVNALEDLKDLHPFPRLLLEYREVSKLLSTYIDSFPELVHASTGRIHTDFSQTLTVTGRLSSSKPNLQNIPIRTERGKKIRKAFRAPQSKLLLGADYSQIELRLLAVMSRDATLLQAFHDDADIHRRTAALILGRNEKSITDDERRMAKTINFGIIYGQTAFGLSRELGITKSEAQKFIDGYFQTYPGIAEYSYEAVQIAKKNKSVRTLAGRIRPLKEIDSKNVPLRMFAERSALNSPLQGTAADLIKLAMVRIDTELQTLKELQNSQLILQVHDELLFETNELELRDLERIVKEIMEDRNIFKAFDVEPFPITLKVEVGSGCHWGEI
jgi:DNA polymerase-1